MMRPITDPYAVLGVAPDASEQQLRQAYRGLAKRYHPDLHPDAQASERMQRINQAWHILSSPIRRARYDGDQRRPAPPGSAGHWSGSPRRSSPAGASNRMREPGWASAGQAGTYPRSATWGGASATSGPQSGARREPLYEPDESVPRWSAVLVTVAVAWLVLAAGLVGLLPGPLLAIAFLFVASRFFRRFD